jgi:hypothetical protein
MVVARPDHEGWPIGEFVDDEGNYERGGALSEREEK